MFSSAFLAHKRFLQIAITGTLTLVSLVGEWRLTQTSLTLMQHQLTAQILDDSAATASALAGVLQQTTPGGTLASPEGQQYAQHLVEHLQVGRGGFVMILNDEGIVVAHPVSSFVGTDLGKDVLQMGDTSRTFAEIASHGQSVTGVATDVVLDRKRHLVATQWIPELHAEVCVYQDEDAVARGAAEMRTFTLRATFLMRGMLLIAIWFIVGTLVDQYESRISQLARTDSLTGLSNRRVLKEFLDREYARARRHGSGLAAVAMDLDHFKSINDMHGHDAGDRALVAMAETLKRFTRASDLCVRLGGDEFLLLMPDTNPERSQAALDRLRQAFPLIFTLIDGQSMVVEASCGMVLLQPNQTAEQLLAAADAALYQQKTKRHAARAAVAPSSL